MTLPLSNLKFSCINVELYNSSCSATLSANNFSVRKLASTGNTGQSLTPNTQIRMCNLLGHARYTESLATCIQNPNLVTCASANTRYALGKTWLTYTVGGTGRVGSVSADTAALTNAAFSNGDIFEVVINAGGYVVGAGGRGSKGGGTSSNTDSGQPGGTAIEILNNSPNNIYICNNGIIGGGGGGGGGGSGDDPNFGSAAGGGGGGGGAGFLTIYTGPAQSNPTLVNGDIQGGVGGAGGSTPGDDGQPGKYGSLLIGGAGGDSGTSNSGCGGRGGNLGQSGQNGSSNGNKNNNTNGGPAGKSIVGYAYTCYINLGSGQLCGLTG